MNHAWNDCHTTTPGLGCLHGNPAVSLQSRIILFVSTSIHNNEESILEVEYLYKPKKGWKLEEMGSPGCVPFAEFCILVWETDLNTHWRWFLSDVGAFLWPSFLICFLTSSLCSVNRRRFAGLHWPYQRTSSQPSPCLKFISYVLLLKR
jgi:hypothetical protein